MGKETLDESYYEGEFKEDLKEGLGTFYDHIDK